MEEQVPSFSFPFQIAQHGKKREIFSYYGSCCIINVSNNGQIFRQRVQQSSTGKLVAMHPVLPINKTPNRVVQPCKDRVMGNVIEKNRRSKEFCTKVNWLRRHKEDGKLKKMRVVESLLSFIEESRDTGELEQLMEPWFHQLLMEYKEVANMTDLLLNNYKYSGGCLSYLPISDRTGYMVSVGGPKFDNIMVTKVSEKVEGLLQMHKVAEMPVQDTVFEITCAQVQNQGFVGVKTDEACHLLSLGPDQRGSNALTELHKIKSTEGCCFRSLSLSPYIPGECAVITADGTCSLHTASQQKQVIDNLQPRFQVTDHWQHVHWGSHPRQLTYCDQTVVQMLDLRVPCFEGTDIFSLPSNKHLHNRERIRTCGHNPELAFYHTIATDYSLMLLDERFRKYPVLKWDHLLSCPPQYLSMVNAGNEARTRDYIVYVGSQYPAEVHGFEFSLTANRPPVAVSLPYRAAKIVDMSSWPQFTDVCTNPSMLRDRLNVSLAGLAVAKWKNGHMVLQLDSHGEIFHQGFLPDKSGASDKTFSASHGSQSLKPSNAAIERARTWITAWEDWTKISAAAPMKHVHALPSLWGVFHYRTPHASCKLCRPQYRRLLDGTPPTKLDDMCYLCLQNVHDSNKLLISLEQGKIMPCVPRADLVELPPTKCLSQTSALSRLLLKHWAGDDEIEEVLKDWDKEVLDRRLARKHKDNIKSHNDMSEASVTKRLLAATLTDAILGERTAKPSSIEETYTTDHFRLTWSRCLASSSVGALSDSGRDENRALSVAAPSVSTNDSSHSLFASQIRVQSSLNAMSPSRTSRQEKHRTKNKAASYSTNDGSCSLFSSPIMMPSPLKPLSPLKTPVEQKHSDWLGIFSSSASNRKNNSGMYTDMNLLAGFSNSPSSKKDLQSKLDDSTSIIYSFH